MEADVAEEEVLTLAMLKKRHTAETKAMQAEVSKLKQQRKKLSKKQKEQKKVITQKMRQLIRCTRVKQRGELSAAGFGGSDDEEQEGAEADAGDMSDDEDL
eukprot:CAMPEP_0194538632 /NCGR_PEP_ID=MMETSP0253-20130528/78242_1 /TAXON_ID=2966 /ORGANISM="Noctiluca scintillans" /LENGTH=100 /DNA_ID=CAMNT_0039384785 /DNA_START=120 /DNA_END=422 /DNA_ORIENTATION=-